MPRKLATDALPEQQYTFPAPAGACIDRLYELDLARGKAQEKVDTIKAEYNALEAHVLRTLPKSDLDGALGRKATAKITRSDVPNVTDWKVLYDYIKRNNAWDLLQKRVSAVAFRDRWADKKTIPGTEIFVKIGLSVTKRS